EGQLSDMRLDQCFQLRPRRHRHHLGQKHVALRALLLPCKAHDEKLSCASILSPPNQGHSVPCSTLLFRGLVENGGLIQDLGARGRFIHAAGLHDCHQDVKIVQFCYYSGPNIVQRRYAPDLRKTIEPAQAREGRKACLPRGGYRSWLFSLGVDKDAIRCPAACADEHQQTRIVSDRGDLRDTSHKPSAALTPWMQRDVHCPASPRMTLSRVARADCYFLKPWPGQAPFRKYLDVGILEGEGIQN